MRWATFRGMLGLHCFGISGLHCFGTSGLFVGTGSLEPQWLHARQWTQHPPPPPHPPRNADVQFVRFFT